MLIFLPVMLFPNAPNNVRLCFKSIPVMLPTYFIILHFFTTQHCRTHVSLQLQNHLSAY